MMNEEAMAREIVVQVKLFASLRQAVGVGTMSCSLPVGATVADLVQRLVGEYPRLPAAAGAIYAAINRVYAGDGTVLSDGDEVALFPPVSGGQDAAGGPRPTRRKVLLRLDPAVHDALATALAAVR